MSDWTLIAARYRDLVDSGVDLGKRPPDETVLVWILRALEVLVLAEAERMVKETEPRRGKLKSLVCIKCGKVYRIQPSDHPMMNQVCTDCASPDPEATP